MAPCRVDNRADNHRKVGHLDRVMKPRCMELVPSTRRDTTAAAASSGGSTAKKYDYESMVQVKRTTNVKYEYDTMYETLQEGGSLVIAPGPEVAVSILGVD